MNDRFKFRVWNPERNEFIYNIQDVGSDFSIRCLEDCFGDFLFNEDYIIEQCTGLKDKNGKLIYENDYIKIKGTVYKVFWNKTKISLDNILKKDIIDIDITQNIEVVGNVHEARDSKKV